MRVLLIEDDYAVSQSVETILKKEGMVVDTTDDGEDGLDCGKLYDYDIIILDGPNQDSSNETLIAGLADVTCFVCRAGKTAKAAIAGLEKMNSDNNCQSSSCIVLNKLG